jgi:hypothetical protein
MVGGAGKVKEGAYEEDAVGEAVGGVIVEVGHLADGVEEMEHIDDLLLRDVVRSRHLLELAQRLSSCCRHTQRQRQNKTKFEQIRNAFQELNENGLPVEVRTMMGGLFFLVRMSTWRARIT